MSRAAGWQRGPETFTREPLRNLPRAPLTVAAATRCLSSRHRATPLPNGLRTLVPGPWKAPLGCYCRPSLRGVVAKANNDDVEKKNRQNEDEGDFWDPMLIAGDTLMLIATEMSSDRIPLEDQGFLCFVVCTSWTLVAFARGDYKHSNLDLDQFADFFVLAPMLASMKSALYTWVPFVLLVAGILAYMVSEGLFDPTILQHEANESPAMTEVLVGAVFTMASWRGIYAGLFL